MKPLALLLALCAGTAHAGYACRDLADPEARRWFQPEPCAAGYVHDPLPPTPLIHEAPALPAGWGYESAGSEWQRVPGCRRCGYWVERGTAVFVPVMRRGAWRGRR